MDGDTDAETGDDGDPSAASDRGAGPSGLDRDLLSDLSVNAIPLGIIVAFTLVVVVAPPGGAGRSVLLFHGALIGGVVLVSAVAGWAIRRLGAPLEGSAARSYDTDSDRE